MTGQVILASTILSPAKDDATLEDTLEALARDHARLVYKITYSVLRNHHDAEDATQEVFLRVMRYKKQLAAVRDPRTWVARIAWRVAIDGRPRAQSVSLDDTGTGIPGAIAQIRSSGASPESLAQSRQMQTLLERLIVALPADLRDPVVLSAIQELNSTEIAEVLGIPEASARTRLMRGRKLLREKLSAVLEGQHA